jgi:hypothetical protein
MKKLVKKACEVCIVAALSAPASAGASPQTAAAAPTPTQQPNETKFGCTLVGLGARDDGCSNSLTLPPAEKVADGKTVSSPPRIIAITVGKHEEAADGSCAENSCATVVTFMILPKRDTPNANAKPTAAQPQSTSGTGSQTTDASKAPNANDDVSGARMRVIVRSAKQPVGGSDAPASVMQPLTASDAPTRAMQLVLALGPDEPKGFVGEVEIAREDFGQEDVTVDMSIRHVALHDSNGNTRGWFIPSLATGQTERRWITQPQYAALQNLGTCTSARDESCGRVTADTYTLVSNALGRLPAREFVTQKRANRSEPIVLFIGLGGDTAIVLMDCRFEADLDETVGQKTCARKAEPWSISFERAPYFWAAYLEDIDTPFRTSIDVEFRDHSEHADYEEFHAESPETDADRHQLAGSCGDMSCSRTSSSAPACRTNRSKR